MLTSVLIFNYRMDKSAVGHDYVAKVEKHESQTDYSKGFGGKFGVQTDRVDKVRRHSLETHYKYCQELSI